MTWFIYALISAIIGVAYSVVARKLSVESENPRALSIVFNGCSALIALSLFLFENWWFNPVPLHVWGLVILSVVLYAVFEGTQFYGRKYVDVSTSSIIFRLNTVIAVFTSFVFLRESITVNKIIATLLILFGTYLVTVKNLSLKFNKGFIYILVATFAIGLVRPVDKTAAAFFSPALYTVMVYIGPAFVMLFFQIIKLQELWKEVRLGRYLIPLLGIINVFEYYFMIKAYSLADASLVVPIVSLSTVFKSLSALFSSESETIYSKSLRQQSSPSLVCY